MSSASAQSVSSGELQSSQNDGSSMPQPHKECNGASGGSSGPYTASSNGSCLNHQTINGETETRIHGCDQSAQDERQSESIRDVPAPTNCQVVEDGSHETETIHSISNVSNTDPSNNAGAERQEITPDELSPKLQRKQLRELMVASADCWDDDLSDDESPQKMPIEWEASMVRRQMNRKRGDPPGTIEGVPSPNNNEPLFEEDEFDTNPTNKNPEYQMSLPEQLLRNRLARKQRLQKKHELFIRHQQNYEAGNSSQNSFERQSSNGSSTQHSARRSRDNFNFLSRSKDSHGRSMSPLFPDDNLDDDNVSVVASSNGSIPLSSHYSSSPNNKTPYKQTHNTPNSPLESLPQRPIVPIPDEADRKRVIGCLAAVLASSYSYETVPELLVKKTTVGASHVISNPVPKEDAAEDEQLWHTQEPMHQQYLSQKQPKQSSRSFQHAHSMGDISTRNSFQSKPNFFSSFNNKFEMNSQKPPSQFTAELAEIRHRIRRHAVLSELLVSSAEMLLLDPMHARAYLQMLEPLMSNKDEEETKSVAPKKESWKGRGFGGGGVHANAHLDGTMSVHGAPCSSYNRRSSSSNRISSSLHGTSPSTQTKPFSPSSLPRAPLVFPKVHTKSPEADDAFISDDVSNQSMRSLDTTNHGLVVPTQERRPSSPASTTMGYSPLDTIIVEKEHISPFLETLTPGAGFRCIALLLLNHLLRDGRGYDARVRQAFKRLAVVILSHELKVGGILRVDLEDDDNIDALLWSDIDKKSTSDEEFHDADELALLATRKFEAMEHAIAAKLIAMSKVSESSSKKSQRRNPSSPVGTNKQLANSTSSVSHGRIALALKETPLSSQHGLSREQIMRGIKIGTAGAVGATLFALTGGLAAPGIAAGLAAVAGGSAVAVGVTTVLSSAAAVSTIFGVGGAGLAGYKMHRRTKGLTEFDFQKEGMSKSNEAELFSTVCISGWLRDSRDFQRPWGVSPSHPRIVDKLELLERFYFIHNPSNLDRCQKILKHWKGRYFQLWKALNEKYGTDPSNLFPLREGPRISAELTHEETEAVSLLLKELGYLNKTEANHSSQNNPASSVTQTRSSPPAKLLSVQQEIKDSLTAQKGLLESFGVSGPELNISTISSNLSLFEEDSQVTPSKSDDKSTQAETATSTTASDASTKQQQPTEQKPDKAPPKHLLTVWDYNANFGGELYTVKWESDLLMELCDSVTDQMIEWGISGTKTILHTTVFATLMTAVTIPYSLAMASNVIDDTWAMAMERADQAGIELAKSLIDSHAGHRPVVLVGFSMGARVIYSCLKELTRQQEIWEDEQQKIGLPPTSGRKQSSRRKSDDEKLKYIREPASIIEDAIMMGMPNHVSLKSWESSRRVVAGRLINCYSRKDMILSLMFQLKRMQGILKPVCGTSPVVVNGVENFDVTDLVSAHTDYCLVTGEILKRVRHLQPQRPSVSQTEVALTSINVANYGITPLSDEAAVPKR